jgi:hypothetical protein
MVVLVALYVSSGSALTGGVMGLVTDRYLMWVVGVFAGLLLLLGAYWVRTRIRPWRSWRG